VEGACREQSEAESRPIPICIVPTLWGFWLYGGDQDGQPASQVSDESSARAGCWTDAGERLTLLWLLLFKYRYLKHIETNFN